MACLNCDDRPGWCDACGGSSSRDAMLGVAGARGHFWAADVLRKVGHPRPWPPFEGKARGIALRKVADLGGDEGTRELRARVCWETAGRAYEEESLFRVPEKAES